MGLSGYYHLFALKILFTRSKELKNKVGWKHGLKPNSGRPYLPGRFGLDDVCEQGEWGHRSCARGSQAQEADGPWGWGDEPGSAQLLKFRQEESKAINIECKYHSEGKP